MTALDYHQKMHALYELGLLPGLTWADKIAYLGYKLHNDETCPLSHIFEGNWYIREIKIPAYHIFIGRPHLTGHICKLVSGRVLHITEEKREVINAPYTLLTTVNYQVVLYSFTDVIGRTYHHNPLGCRDVEVLESEIFAPVELVLARGKQIADELLLKEAV